MSDHTNDPNQPGFRRCRATSKGTGEQCKRRAAPGAVVCVKHGAAAGQVKRAASRRLQAEEARQTVVKLGLVTGVGKIDPRDALELELWRTHVNVLMYEQLCAELPLEEGGIYGKTYHVSGREGEAKPHVLVAMRDRERTHLAGVAVAAAKAGVEERRVQLEQERGQLVADLLRAVFGDPELGLDAERQRTAGVVAARHLRALGA